ncbi:MAG: serine hydrolase [Bacteroidales bacterium]|nr:serine hydrolase [Candidatus Cryptobacteroides equifaecalis]
MIRWRNLIVLLAAIIACTPLSGAVAKNLSKAGRANCYLIDSPGAYRFDATKKGHADLPLDGQPVMAEVLWEGFGSSQVPEKGSVIQSAEFKDGFVYLQTPVMLKNGNALVAVRDSAGKILWSWHIWVCEGYDPEKTAQTYFNNAGTVMDRNLGATSCNPGDVEALGLIYQWGRKDPFRSGTAIDSGHGNPAATTLQWPEPVESDRNTGTIAYTIQHPTTFITYNKENMDWFYTGDSATDDTRWNTDKGIYDPCPYGWKVPEGGLDGLWVRALGSPAWFLGPWDDEAKGMNFSGLFGADKSIWYPAAGCGEYRDGMLHYVGASALYWSCTTKDSNAYMLDFYVDKGFTNPERDNYRAYGRVVRCVRDEAPAYDIVDGIEAVDLGLSVKWARGAAEPAGRWRKASDAEISELKAMCEWTRILGKKMPYKGYKVKSRVNGNAIFIEDAAPVEQRLVLDKREKPSPSAYRKDASANCHIVPPHGSVKFDAVKGNSKESVGEVSSVDVLSGAESVFNVEYSRGKIFVAASDVEGNAIVAARGSDGTILWSWHIWVTDFNPEKTSVSYRNGAGVMMDRNLGALSSIPGDPQATGLLYQWGRKDPLRQGCKAASPEVKADIDFSVRNPEVFIPMGRNRDWLYTEDGSVAEKGRWAEKKTIYDPCPPGWRVPDGGHKGVLAVASGTLRTEHTWDPELKGTDISDIISQDGSGCWYPFAGIIAGGRYLDMGIGRYWTSTLNYEDRPFNISFNFQGMCNFNGQHDSSPAVAMSVRCVREGKISKDVTIDLSLGEQTANTYIIPRAGKYRFNASVKGNSRESVGDAVSFKVDADPSLFASSAYRNGWVELETPAEFKEGNAKVSVLDAAGKALWTWNIWLCRNYEPESSYTEFKNGLCIMDRELGTFARDPLTDCSQYEGKVPPKSKEDPCPPGWCLPKGAEGKHLRCIMTPRTNLHSRPKELDRTEPQAAVKEAVAELETFGKPVAVMVLQHGNVIFEKRYTDRKVDMPMPVGSVSKTVTALAVGIAIREGRLTMDDRFDGYSVRSLLTNTRSGSFFMESACNDMLYEMLRKVTGQNVNDYLAERLWLPLRIEKPSWTVSGGLYLKVEDMAKIGQLLLDGGSCKGRQILDGQFVKEMISFQTESAPLGVKLSERAQKGLDSSNSDWACGYGYGIWHSRHDTLHAEGISGQFLILAPRKDAVIVLVNGTNLYQKYLDKVWETILPVL